MTLFANPCKAAMGKHGDEALKVLLPRSEDSACAAGDAGRPLRVGDGEVHFPGGVCLAGRRNM